MKPITLVALLILALAGGGYFLFFAPPASQAGSEDPEGQLEKLTGDRKEEKGPDIKTPGVKTDGKTDPDGSGPERVSGDGRKDFPQGIQGQVASSAGGTLRDAEVYLLRGIAPQDMIHQLALFGGNRPPAKIAAETRTDGNGVFKLPSPVTRGAANFVLHVKAVGHKVHTQEIRVSAENWMKLALIKLDKGMTIRGTVRDQDSKTAIVGATVRVVIPTLNFFVPTPGLEDGLEATTDRSGRYELQGVPQGPVEIRAFAKGYGTMSRPDVVFEAGQHVRTEDLDLPKGYEIEGWIVDADGDPISRARVEATSFTAQSGTNGHAYTDGEGRFAILGLSKGSYIVSAKAPGYVKNEKKPVASGDKEIQIVLEKQGTIIARVMQRNSRPLSSYRLELKRFFEGQEHFGRTDVEPVEVRGARNGEYTLSGIDPGDYVVQVEGLAFAKTYSKPFKIVEGQQQPTRVEVTMNEGGTIFGIVTDQGGMPVKGASVFTVDNSYQDNPLTRMFRGLMPVKITEGSDVTDNKGRFRLSKLTPAKYQLKIDHPDYSRTYRKDLDVQEGQKLDTGMIKMTQGGLVRGTVMCGGQVKPACKVTISSVAGPGGNLGVFEEVFTNEKGEFAFPRRLAPGKYEIQAARTDHANPLMQLADIQNSKKEVTVTSGTSNVQIQIPN